MVGKGIHLQNHGILINIDKPHGPSRSTIMPGRPAPQIEQVQPHDKTTVTLFAFARDAANNKNSATYKQPCWNAIQQIVCSGQFTSS